MRHLLLGLVLFLGWAVSAHAQRGLLTNGGFEGGAGRDGKGGGIPDWLPFEQGYDIDRQIVRNGAQSLRCDSANEQSRRGGYVRLTLNQTRPIPILVTGWSKADAVSGTPDSDYALYIDLEYMDGTSLWGQTAPFRTGTHDWERRQALVLPTKPIRHLLIYALFRRHRGTAWFDDFYARELGGEQVFDTQVLPLPPRPPQNGKTTLSISGKDGLALEFDSRGEIRSVRSGGQEVGSGATGGFFARDVGVEGPILPLRGSVRKRALGGLALEATSGDLRVRFSAKILPENDALIIDGEMTDVTRSDRAITVYFALPVQATGWQWGQDIRQAETIAPGREYTNQVRVNVGATGGLSLYPFACVSNTRHALGIASQMDWPGVFRLFYNSATRQFVIAWDVALTRKTSAWPAGNARFRCTLFRLPPGQAAWGFRAAAQRFYRLNGSLFQRRAKAEGIWIAFTDPSRVENHADFGFAYHEGDNSLKSDDALDILSFRYTEPTTYWMPMPPEMPRTYENALKRLHEYAAQTPTAETKFHVEMAKAVLSSGAQDENGKFLVEFQNQPWTNGAVFVLNPNPELPNAPDKPTRASVAYNFALANTMYGPNARATRGEQDGEYLDTLEGWADFLDMRPSNLQACPYPLTFDTDSRRPVLPQWYGVHSFARYLRDDLRSRGKLLMANTTPIRFSIFAPLFDVMGMEVNWLDASGNWRPDSDAAFCLRRTLSAQKPYLLLMNTNYDQLTLEKVEKYFQRSLFYGVYPSMFSADASTNPYWENPRWYNRDRALFKKYIPVIKTLSAAGWQPITQARSAQPGVYVERFGARHFTALNDTVQPQKTTLTIALAPLGLNNGTRLKAVNLLTSAEMETQQDGTTLRIPLSLQPEEALALTLQPR
jgi:hypothetical protein